MDEEVETTAHRETGQETAQETAHETVQETAQETAHEIDQVTMTEAATTGLATDKAVTIVSVIDKEVLTDTTLGAATTPGVVTTTDKAVMTDSVTVNKAEILDTVEDLTIILIDPETKVEIKAARTILAETNQQGQDGH